MKRQLAVLFVVLLAIGSTVRPSDSTSNGDQTFIDGEGGSLVHKPSGIVFPAHVDDFVRDSTHQYKADGSDVSAAYNRVRADGLIAATSYVYPSPRLISIGSPQDVIDKARRHLSKDELARCKQEIVHAIPKPC